MKNVFNRNFFKSRSIQAALIGIIGLLLVGTIFAPISKKIIDSIFTKTPDKRIQYEIKSIKNLSKNEIIKAINENFTYSKIDFSYDDNILDDYFLTTIDIKNLGDPIQDDFFLNLIYKEENIKIMDVLCKFIEPLRKEVNIETDRPPLEYEFPSKDSIKIEISTSPDFDQSATNSFVYRSYSKDVGFGRRNPSPIVDNTFQEIVKNGGHYWYKISLESLPGSELGISDTYPWPESWFNRPFFKNTKTIFPVFSDDKYDMDCLYDSLKQTLSELKENEKVYIDIEKNEFKIILSKKLSDAPIYFKNDIEFLFGRTSIYIDDLLENSLLRIFLISKTYLEMKKLLNLEISLKNIGNIKVIKKKNISYDKPNLNKQITIDKNAALTPFRTRLFLGKNKIILAWSEPENSNVEGYRIFRTHYSQRSEFAMTLDNELYDGAGKKGLLLGASPYIRFFRNNEPAQIKRKKILHISLPPRKIKRNYLDNRPPTPIINSIRLMANYPVNVYNGNLMRYYIDKDVKLGETYLYTLFAYDNKGTYSYPIESIIKYEQSEVYTEIIDVENYKSDIKSLNILKKYYLENKYLNEASKLDSIITYIDSSLSSSSKLSDSGLIIDFVQPLDKSDSSKNVNIQLKVPISISDSVKSKKEKDN